MASINQHLYAVILAGGSGTRFWPMSRNNRPKQFLKIIGSRSLLQETIKRINSQVPSSHIYVVTNVRFQNLVHEQTAPYRIPRATILWEPQGKNTAPAIAWAAAVINQRDPNGIMAVFPSDHIILNQQAFLKNFEQAVSLAQQHFLVTMGIVPTRPETGYGYLKIKSSRFDGKKIWRVEQFTEKPSLKLAERFLRRKKYLWNSGMFFWRCDVILNQIQKFLPPVYAAFEKKSHQAHAEKIWPRLPSISIDYGILEKAPNVATIPAKNIAWSDLGSWESLMEYFCRDTVGNIIRGDVVEINCKNMMISTDKRLVAAIGLQDVILIDTPDALLVCRKDCSQQVKEIVDMLKNSQWKSLL
jgi:mannose-1-phosphate guanylyltransferase